MVIVLKKIKKVIKIYDLILSFYEFDFKSII